MKSTKNISLYLQMASRWVLYGFLFLFPLFFLPLTLDPLEINKQSLLLVSVCLSFVLLIGSILLNKEMRVRLGWSQLFPVGIVIAFAVSAVFSFAPFTSWIGTSGAEYTSVLTWIGLALLFYLVTMFQKELELSKTLWMILVSSACLAGLIGVLSVFGVSIIPFFPALAVTAFNTIGTANTLAIFLIAMSLYACSILLTSTEHDRTFPKGPGRFWMYSVIGLLFVETLVLLIALDYALLWILFLAGNALLFVFTIFRPKAFPSMNLLFTPVIFTVVSALFWFFLPSPFSTNLPLEVSPSFSTSTAITNATLRDVQPLFGTGPGTYGMDYAKYHSKALNETDFWNTRFDRASSFMLTLAPTVGYLGAGLFLFFILYLLAESTRKIVSSNGLFAWSESNNWIDVFHVFVPWFVIALAAFLFSFNSSLVITFLLFSALLAAQTGLKEKQIKFSSNKAIALLSAVCFIVLAFGLFIGIFFTTGRYAAEIAFTKAVRADRAKVDTKIIVAQLDRASTLNQWNDDYVRNLSGALLLRVQDELKSVSPNAPLSDASKKYLQALVAASVNASARATALSPYSVSNWLMRGNIYRSLTGLVDQSSKFSVEAYKHAINLEPLNPNHWNELGKTQLAIADAIQPLTVSEDPSAAAQAKKDWQAALDEAEKDFTSATVLKSNFAPAHYQLALVYEREGKLDLAIAKLESVLNYNNTDIGVGFELGNLYTKRGGKGDLEKAKAVFEHVIKLAPSYSDAHWFLASVYEKLGLKDAAIKEIEAVLKLNPNNQIVKTRLEKLKS